MSSEEKHNVFYRKISIENKQKKTKTRRKILQEKIIIRHEKIIQTSNCRIIKKNVEIRKSQSSYFFRTGFTYFEMANFELIMFELTTKPNQN